MALISKSSNPAVRNSIKNSNLSFRFLLDIRSRAAIDKVAVVLSQMSGETSCVTCSKWLPRLTKWLLVFSCCCKSLLCVTLIVHFLTLIVVVILDLPSVLPF